jgi:hypothetical protein
MNAFHHLFLVFAVQVSAAAAISPVVKCRDVSSAHSGSGVPYHGTVDNDDYGLRLVLPRGLTGWGAAPISPFHGFTIFLNEDHPASCIAFEIHRRVDLGEAQDHKPPGPRASIRVGNVIGQKEEASGIVDATVFRNVIVSFSNTHNGEPQDGTIWFITPASDWSKYARLFQRFLAQITFK